MTDLSPAARKLLQDARRALDPDPTRLRATEAGLLAKLHDGVPARASEPNLRSSDAHLPLSSAFKLATSVLLAAAGALGAYRVWSAQLERRTPLQPAPPQIQAPLENPAGAAGAEQPKAEPRLDPEAPAPSRPSTATAAAEPARQPRRRSAAAGSRAPGPLREPSRLSGEVVRSPEQGAPSGARPAATPRDTLAAETALIRAARDALERGEPARALQPSDEYQRQFPNGFLRAEHLLLRALAYCALGQRAAAESSARELAALTPGSRNLSRIARACTGAR